MVYLDNASTTEMSDAALKEMIKCLTNDYGNPGSNHNLGVRANNIVRKAREKVASLLNCSPENVIFTSGGSEANNLAIKGLDRYADKGFDYVVSSIEHESLISSALDTGRNIIFANPNNDGVVTLESVKNAVTENTILVSVMHTNNETGIKNEVEEIGKWCKDNAIYFHIDCVHAANYCNIDVNKFECDFLSISAHKIHGPKGIGALYVKDLKTIKPLINGGKNQEFGFRAGTENVPAISSFGVVCEETLNYIKDNEENIFNENNNLKRNFIKYIKKYLISFGIDDNIVHVNCNENYNNSKTINLRFDGIDSDTLVMAMGNLELYSSSGSACRENKADPSEVLLKVGLTEEQARSSVRFSFSRYTTYDDLMEAAGIISACISALRC